MADIGVFIIVIVVVVDVFVVVAHVEVHWFVVVALNTVVAAEVVVV